MRQLQRLTIALPLLLVAACSTTPNYPVPATKPTSVSKLESAPPMEIAVAPVENHGADARIPLDVLRDALGSGLIESAYSPLDVQYVDTQLAAAPSTDGGMTQEGSLGARKPDAWLRVSVDSSDARLFPTTGAFFVSGKAEMVSGDGAEVLWSVDLTRRLELGPTYGMRVGDGAFLQQAARLFAAEVVKLIPVRRAALAPKPI
ncbi:MAG: hypothetical protein EPO68_04635 [Planctomycetota bacterium]|nr:MAG: hypothetical protein EPO68_04635 [Planctomycetota bacterium]